MIKNKKKDVNKQKNLETRGVKIRNFFTQPLERPTDQESCVIQRYQDQEKKSRKIRMKFFNIIGDFFTSLFTPIKNSATQAVNVINISYSSIIGDVVNWPPRTSTENSDAFKDVFSFNREESRYVSLNKPPNRNKESLYMYDKRINNGSGGVLDFGGGYDYIDVYSFEPVFSNGFKKMKIHVNSELDYDEAEDYAFTYAILFGQMPRALVESIDALWIHKKGFDKYLAIDGNKIVIYLEHANIDHRSGTLGEILFHEATHTAIDKFCINNPAWSYAQKQDAKWISNYAKDNPSREDVAESFLPYFALRYRRNAITDVTAQIIENVMPNRIVFFDNLIRDYRLDMNLL